MRSMTVESPGVSLCEGSRAFTLVELLIVVGIIGLLVTLIMPSLGRARDLAKKSVCAMQEKAYGSGVLLFVSEKEVYPEMGTIGLGWPKFYGVLHAQEVEPPETNKVWNGVRYVTVWQYDQWELDEVWDKAFCPAMDAVRLIRSTDRWNAEGRNPAGQASLHRAAAGYQWNVCLRGPGNPTPMFGSGRWPTALWQPPGGGVLAWDNTMWIQFPLELVQPGYYIAQAITPDEIEQPAMVAEAWDSWDIESIPGITWGSPAFDHNWALLEKIAPGWHVGPQSYAGSGYALLNGGRHPTAPNVLYADGHVESDATHEVNVSDLPSLPGGGTWRDAKLVSWSDWDATFGTMHHMVPERSFATSP